MRWRLKEPPRGHYVAASIAQSAIELRTTCAVDYHITQTYKKIDCKIHLTSLLFAFVEGAPLYFIVHVSLVFSKQGDNVLWVRSVLCSARTWSIHSANKFAGCFPNTYAYSLLCAALCCAVLCGTSVLLCAVWCSVLCGALCVAVFVAVSAVGELPPRRRWVKCGGCIVLPQHVRHNYSYFNPLLQKKLYEILSCHIFTQYYTQIYLYFSKNITNFHTILQIITQYYKFSHNITNYIITHAKYLFFYYNFSHTHNAQNTSTAHHMHACKL